MHLNKPTHYLLAAGLILALAVTLRWADLELKPPHFDEGINGGFVDGMRAKGGYHYDPTNYHGPLHFYLVLLSQTLFGHNLAALRLPSVLAGIGVVAVALWGYRRHLGDAATLWFGGFLAVSPALVFVSRYAIHEMEMVLFIEITVLGLLNQWSGRRGAWLICTGVAGMILSKETYVIHIACLALAWALWRGLQRVAPDSPPSPPPTFRWREFAEPAIVSLAAILFFYSANLTWPAGVAGLWTTFAAWTQTGLEHGGHAKPWHYWLALMWRYEWLALAGFAASARYLWAGPKGIRIAVIAGAGTLAAYSIVSYKTPWCIATFLWSGSLALAWLLARTGERGPRWRAAALGVGLLLAGHDLWAAWRLNWRHYDDPDEPYVYVQTYREVARFTEPLLRAASQDALMLNRTGVIVVDSPFPLPWMLRDFVNLRFVDQGQPTGREVTLADYVLVQGSRREEVEARLYGEFLVVDLRLRSGHEPMTAYFRERIYAPFVQAPAVLKAFGGRNPLGGREVTR